MKACLISVCLFAYSAFGQDISFNNKIATFTNLQGNLYKGVQLVRGDPDGIIWRSDASGGRVCYTNLHPDILVWLGVPTNRIAIAKARAEHKSITDAKFRAEMAARAAAEARVKQQAIEKWNADAPAREREAQGCCGR